VVALAVLAFGAIDLVQGRDSGLGFGRALVLGAAQAAGWGLLAPGARALGRRFPMGRAARPAALLVHGGFAAAFALVKSALDVGAAQMLVAGAPPAGPGFAGNALVYVLLAASAAQRPAATTPTTQP
jgi:hypothetical protein